MMLSIWVPPWPWREAELCPGVSKMGRVSPGDRTAKQVQGWAAGLLGCLGQVFSIESNHILERWTEGQIGGRKSQKESGVPQAYLFRSITVSVFFPLCFSTNLLPLPASPLSVLTFPCDS